MTTAERWLTYAELAEEWHVSPEAARQRAMRKRYQRRVGNDGLARICVQADEPCPSTKRDRTKPPVQTGNEQAIKLAALEVEIAGLKELVARIEADATHWREHATALASKISAPAPAPAASRGGFAWLKRMAG